jgi:methylglutaconyl-CoA hydratase
MYQALTYDIRGSVAFITLSRPSVFNAFDSHLIEELTQAFLLASQDKQVRVCVLSAQGKHFSSGADLNWMKDMAQADEKTNLFEAEKMSLMFEAIANCTKPTVALVHGFALGGGTGLVAACDIAIGAHTTQMAFTEVRLGIVPAVISPYIFNAIGARAASRYFQTGERFNAETALRLGLLHEVVEDNGDGKALENALQHCLKNLLAGAPEAQATCKHMIKNWGHLSLSDDLRQQTISLIAKTRAKQEAKEGFKAFFAKQEAPWVQKI